MRAYVRVQWCRQPGVILSLTSLLPRTNISLFTCHTNTIAKCHITAHTHSHKEKENNAGTASRNLEGIHVIHLDMLCVHMKGSDIFPERVQLHAKRLHVTHVVVY